MCQPCLLEDVLISPQHSLVKQVHEHFLPGLIPHDPKDLEDCPDNLVKLRNSAYNIDGFGVAWYTSSAADFEQGDTGQSSDGMFKEGLRPAFYKTVTPPINDLNFRSICANTETRVCFAHIRAASGTPIVQTNNHPFVFGRHTCMHNGVITSFPAIRRAMLMKMSDAAHATMVGTTDSEHIFALYITYLTQNGDRSSFEKTYTVHEMAAALHDAVATVIGLQIELLGTKVTPNSLNLCVTDGIKLVAYRFRNHSTQEPPSLYYSTKAGTTLNRKYPDHPDGANIQDDANRIPRDKHGKHLIVASEPTTYREADWHLIGKNQLLMADEQGGVRLADIPYDQAWNAIDPTVDS
ncbi:hypothetical protein LTR05_007896 [Lithohypha guttulata]|uniref:Glutamine amidotransferase type-2 domain-containing protein n=1 Tax=Lithohypha guttulata TaxID=1690604 RepID=A0AAN7SUD9_9EURO|nr:hypothetical protein LTR05_007896 [Lithohypha guttulata]